MGRSWSARDTALLRDSIENHSIKWIASQLERTYGAVYDRAGELGLLRDYRQGLEALSVAAERCGVGHETLRRILRWAGVATVAGKRERPGRYRRSSRHYVEPDTADEAVARWTRSETLRDAVRRLGISESVLRRGLVADGVLPPVSDIRRRIRLDPATYDIVAARERERIRVMARARGAHAATVRHADRRGETVEEAAVRLGRHHNSIRRALRVAGIQTHSGRHPHLDPAAVDAAMAAYRAHITRLKSIAGKCAATARAARAQQKEAA